MCQNHNTYTPVWPFLLSTCKHWPTITLFKNGLAEMAILRASICMPPRQRLSTSVRWRSLGRLGEGENGWRVWRLTGVRQSHSVPPGQCQRECWRVTVIRTPRIVGPNIWDWSFTTQSSFTLEQREHYFTLTMQSNIKSNIKRVS